MTTTTLDYLIPYVRLRLGDLDECNYRYLTKWIQTALVSASRVLIKWWNFKYLMTAGDELYRNTQATFLFSEPPVVEPQDDQVLVILATYIILEGSLENSAWDFASWRDAEISYSNLESSRARSLTLQRLWDELLLNVKPPMKRLARPVKGTLPGYLENDYEIGNMK